MIRIYKYDDLAWVVAWKGDVSNVSIYNSKKEALQDILRYCGNVTINDQRGNTNVLTTPHIAGELNNKQTSHLAALKGNNVCFN